MENRFLTPAAVEKLLQVKQHILEEPNRLVMSDWVKQGSRLRDYEAYVEPPCGTAACIAGWVCVLNRQKESAGPYTAVSILNDGSYSDTDNYFDHLFYVSSWDSDLQKRFHTTNLC